MPLLFYSLLLRPQSTPTLPSSLLRPTEHVPLNEMLPPCSLRLLLSPMTKKSIQFDRYKRNTRAGVYTRRLEEVRRLTSPMHVRLCQELVRHLQRNPAQRLPLFPPPQHHLSPYIETCSLVPMLDPVKNFYNGHFLYHGFRRRHEPRSESDALLLMHPCSHSPHRNTMLIYSLFSKLTPCCECMRKTVM